MSHIPAALKIEKQLGRIEKRRTEANAKADAERAEIVAALTTEVRDILVADGVLTEDEASR